MVGRQSVKPEKDAERLARWRTEYSQDGLPVSGVLQITHDKFLCVFGSLHGLYMLRKLYVDSLAHT